MLCYEFKGCYGYHMAWRAPRLQPAGSMGGGRGKNRVNEYLYGTPYIYKSPKEVLLIPPIQRIPLVVLVPQIHHKTSTTCIIKLTNTTSRISMLHTTNSISTTTPTDTTRSTSMKKVAITIDEEVWGLVRVESLKRGVTAGKLLSDCFMLRDSVVQNSHPIGRQVFEPKVRTPIKEELPDLPPLSSDDEPYLEEPKKVPDKVPERVLDYGDSQTKRYEPPNQDWRSQIKATPKTEKKVPDLSKLDKAGKLAGLTKIMGGK